MQLPTTKTQYQTKTIVLKTVSLSFHGFSSRLWGDARGQLIKSSLASVNVPLETLAIVQHTMPI
eukprot:3699-Amphidinium_carterae.2